jgi:hypothetical protein
MLMMITFDQGCGSGLDPDSTTLWIRNPDPDPWARKMKKKGNLLDFLNICIVKR